MEGKFMRPFEVANALRCSTESVRRLIRQGKLPAVQIGRDYRIEQSKIVPSLLKKPTMPHK